MDYFVLRNRLTPYDPEIWNDSTQLPYGLAAGFVFLTGFALALLAADQSWLVGPIAKALGADIAFELALAWVLIAYVPLRILEFKVFKR